MRKIKEVIVVEGRYDKNTLSQIVDATVVTLGGFAVFNDREKVAFLRRLAEERGLIVLTDSDGAGFVIRNYLKGALPRDRVKQELLPVELRLDGEAAAIIPGTPAGEKDFDTEFLDYILAVGVVGSVEEAMDHIAAHSTGHSEAIVTEDPAHAEAFVNGVDSAAVYVNASTRFTDGGEFGLGCEMGISTQKLHARGPMGLDELTTYKYVIRGNGQIR